MEVVILPPTPTTEDQSCNSIFNGLESSHDDESREEIRSIASPELADSHTYSSRDDSDSDEYHDTKETLDSEEEVVGGELRQRTRGPDDVVVDTELLQKIVQQVEFYFSDENITKDKFLLKHIWRNKQGFVSIKLITSFKKVKCLTKDWQVVARAISESSSQLEVNETGTKVRRKSPIPKPDKTSAHRSVVITNFDHNDPSLDEVKGMMSRFGEVVLVRFLRPGTTLPQDVKEHQSSHCEFGVSVCVVVEFKHAGEAEKASSEYAKSANWRTGVRVNLLAKDEGKGGQNKTNDGSPIERRKRNSKKKGNRLEELIAEDGHSTCSSSDAEGLPIPFASKRSSKSPRGTPDSTSYLSTSPTKSIRSGNRSHSPSPEIYRKVSPHSSPRPIRGNVSSNVHHEHHSVSPRASPLLGRRTPDATSASTSPRISGKLGSSSPDWRVIRSPTGPDGTQGFSKRKQKDLQLSRVP
ncbi:la-related protein 6-like [Corticium candelabrum]|uniref:la-related protein 6-like n=1 Tax=Corticium candelabrum TaxID=121492 RepID=UPI002E2670C2|nr:la-related protein 6-like [Corticium candelabrum]